MADNITWLLCRQGLEKLEHMQKAKANIFLNLYVKYGGSEVPATRGAFRTPSNI